MEFPRIVKSPSSEGGEQAASYYVSNDSKTLKQNFRIQDLRSKSIFTGLLNRGADALCKHKTIFRELNAHLL
jgi:hypothetical protein